MKSIFAKTLAAAAIAGVCSANAATITVLSSDSAYTGASWPLVSLEGANLFTVPGISIGTGDNYVPVTVTSGTAYSLADEIKITITGADVLSDSSTPTLNTDGVAFLSAATAGEQEDVLTFVITADSVPAETVMSLSGVNLLLADDAAATVSVAVDVVTNAGAAIESVAATPIARVASEMGVAVASALDGVINVEGSRASFVGGSTADSFALSVSAGADIFGVSPGKATVRVAGDDLSFLMDGTTLDSSSYALTAGGVTGAAGVISGTTALTLISEGNYSTTNMSDVWVNLISRSGASLNAQTFSADVDLGYSLGATTGSFDADGLAIGAWTLSGTTFNIPYMPYGSNISQIIYVSNSGDIDANVELTAFDDEGHTYGPVTLSVQAGADKVTSLASAVAAALRSDDDFDGTGRFDISLTINASSSDLDLFTAYNVGGDRLAADNEVVSSN